MPDAMTSGVAHEPNYLEKARTKQLKRQNEISSEIFTLEEVESECGGDWVEGIYLTNLEPGEYVVSFYDDEPWRFDEFVETMAEEFDAADITEIVVKNGIFKIV